MNELCYSVVGSCAVSFVCDGWEIEMRREIKQANKLFPWGGRERVKLKIKMLCWWHISMLFALKSSGCKNDIAIQFNLQRDFGFSWFMYVSSAEHKTHFSNFLQGCSDDDSLYQRNQQSLKITSNAGNSLRFTHIFGWNSSFIDTFFPYAIISAEHTIVLKRKR